MKSTAQKKTNYPLAYYRMPNEKEAWFLQSECDAVEIDSLKSVPEKAGFILYPFTTDSSAKPYFIQADKHINLSLEDMYERTLVNDQIWEVKDVSTSANIYKTKDEYCKSVADAVKKIHSCELKKVVLSRVKKIAGDTPVNPLMIFHELCIKYPAAFVSLVHVPGHTVWITASPELLISANNNEIRTASIAGTKSVENTEQWGEKEKAEQQIVTDYIHEILEKYCRSISISGTDEIVAGNVKHLKTSFSATLNTELLNLVSALHPTPAVCGFPLDKAKQIIKQTEGYDRKYYTGFLGPFNMNGKTNLFVNLRCAELFDTSVNLYIGGGITKDSIPEKEWEETELKAKTLLFAFEEIKNEKR